MSRVLGLMINEARSRGDRDARPVRSETSISRSPSPPAHQVKIAAAWILRIVRRPSRAAPFAEIYLRPGGRGCVYVFAISGDGSRQTARRAIRIVTMIRVPRRVAVLGTVFTRRVPRASARQRSCAGAGGPRDGYIFFKVRLDLVCRLRLSWRLVL